MGFLDRNRFLECLAEGKVAIGIQARSRSPLIAEVLGLCGFDFLYIETEHFTHDNETIENMIRGAQLGGITPIVRIPRQDGESIGHLLDVGAMGVIIPHVETGEQAEMMVAAAKYAPLGERGASYGCRASMYGFYSEDEYRRLSNRNTSIIAMVESVKGVENIEAICRAGVDLIRVGRSDLSESMGFQGRKDDPAYDEAVDQVIRVAASYGIPCGAVAGSKEEFVKLVKQGFRHLNYQSDLAYLKANLPGDLKWLREQGERAGSEAAGRRQTQPGAAE